MRCWFGRRTLLLPSYLTYKKKKKKEKINPATTITTTHHIPETLCWFVCATFDYQGTNNIKSNQRLVLSVCKVNTISLSHPSDSAALSQLYGGDGTKGTAVECVMKCVCGRLWLL